MNDRNIDLESALQALKFSKPSEDYVSRSMSVIQRHSERRSFWNSRIGIMASISLLLSLGLNLLAFNNRGSLSTEPLLAASSNAATNSEIQESDIAQPNSVFRFLCLTKSTAIINDEINLGELKGFGEWAYFELPENIQLRVSLLPLRQWNAIGQFNDGIITVRLDDTEQLELRDVGMGPSSVKRGGPFPVYGEITYTSSTSGVTGSANQTTSTLEQSNLMRSTASSGNSLGIENIIAGVDTQLSPLTQKYFGALLSSGECG